MVSVRLVPLILMVAELPAVIESLRKQVSTSRAWRSKAGRRFPSDLSEYVKHGGGDDPVYLGAGSFGRVWKAKVSEFLGAGEAEVILKVLFYMEPHGFIAGLETSHLLKETDVKKNDELQPLADQAWSECHVSMSLRSKEARTPELEKGQSRLSACMFTNIGMDKTSKEQKDKPLFLMQEYAGKSTLATYFSELKNAQAWTLATARQIIKQLLEGVNFMAEHGVFHHDVKPENIIVRELEGDKFSVQYIDFGSAVDTSKAVAADIHTFRPCTYPYIPPEWDSEEATYDPDTSTYSIVGYDYHKEYPLAFDIYSLGVLFLDLLTGQPFDVFFKAVRERILHGEELDSIDSVVVETGDNYLVNYTALQQIISNDRFVDYAFHLNASEDKAPYTTVFPDIASALLSDTDAVGFLDALKKCVSLRPQERPSAAHLLSLPWMNNFESFEDTTWPTRKRFSADYRQARGVWQT